MITSKAAKKYLKELLPQQTSEKFFSNINSPIEGVLFDIYGTLFISASGDISLSTEMSHERTQGLQELTQKYDLTMSPDDLSSAFRAAVNKVHEDLKKKGVDYPEVRADELWAQIIETDDIERARDFATENELIVNPVYPMPDLDPTLSALKNKDCVLGIISNAQFYTPLLFEWFLEGRPENIGFDTDLCFYSYQSGYGKPSEFMYKKAGEQLTKMGIPLNRILYVGNDMLNDIMPAQKTGFMTALFAGDKRSLRMKTKK